MALRSKSLLGAACALLLGLSFLVLPVLRAEAVGETTFRNPLLANGADPWLQYYNGNYYLATTTWTSQLVMRKSPTLAGLRTAAPVHVWSDTAADRCCNFWAFEFHRLAGPNGTRWYMMYTAGVSGNLDGQKLRVLESAGDDPMGPYTFRGTPMPTTWNIDGSYLQLGGSALPAVVGVAGRRPEHLDRPDEQPVDHHRLEGAHLPAQLRVGDPGRAHQRGPGSVAAQRPYVHRLLGQLVQHAVLQARACSP